MLSVFFRDELPQFTSWGFITEDIYESVDEDALQALDIFSDVKTFGCLPFSGGWAEQPEDVYWAFKCANIAFKEWESAQHDKSRMHAKAQKGRSPKRPKRNRK